MKGAFQFRIVTASHRGSLDNPQSVEAKRGTRTAINQLKFNFIIALVLEMNTIIHV